MIIFVLLLSLSCFHNIHCDLSRNTPKQPNFRRMSMRLNNRLDNGNPAANLREGRVEVSFNGSTWGTICSPRWSFREANVVCRQLSLGYSDRTNQTQQFGTRNQHPWLVQGIVCRGTENNLRNCFRESNAARTCNAANRNVAVVKCVQQLSDLSLGVRDIQDSAFLDTRPLSSLRCAMEENCLSRDAYQPRPQAVRRLLRFTTRAANVGTADFSPYTNFAQWQWHQCHNHYHSMESFASFDIYDRRYRKVAEGHKASFCLMDIGCRPGIRPRYTCGNQTQGISIGCWDTYGSGLDCQWVDVTTLPRNNTYILRVSLNPEYMVGEISFENNSVECLLRYTGQRNTTRVFNCRRMASWV